MIICSECKKPCDTKIIDVGYGHTEAWGVESIDIQEIEVSVCCEADLEEIP